MGKSTPPLVSVILPITEFEARKHLFSFLDSLFNADYPKSKVEVLLRDNGLREKTKRALNLKYPEIKIVGKGDNIYFAKGVNEAARESSGSWLYIANADTKLHPDSLRKLVKAGASFPNVAIVGPRVFTLGGRSLVSERDLPVLRANYTLATLKNLPVKEILVLTNITDVFWVSGCGMLVKRQVWEELGGFDERFLIYWEDADFGLRAKKRGYRVVLAPEAKIWHKGSVTLGIKSPKKIYYLTRSHLLFLSKNLNFLGKVLMQIKALIVGLVKLGKVIFGIDKERNIAYLLGVKDFYFKRFEGI